MRKCSGVRGIACLVAALMLLSGVAQAAMWVGPEVGGNIINNIDVNFGGATFHKVRVDSSAIGGVTVGYDFVNTGFLAYDWPTWMKYFHVVADFTYNPMNVRGQTVSAHIGGVATNASLPRMEGYMAALAFGVLGSYGFFNGRVNPYVGGGPAILFSGLDSGQLGLGASSSADAALWAEAGIRWAAFKNITIDTSYRFRWARPTYNFNGTGLGFTGYSHSFLARVNYHF